MLLLTTIGVLAFSHGGVAAQAASVSSPDGSSPADAAAIRYVEAQYPGSGQARVLGTEADHKHGAAVYDVRILAPNGTVSVVHVQQRNNVVLSANQAESQRLHRSDN